MHSDYVCFSFEFVPLHCVWLLVVDFRRKVDLSPWTATTGAHAEDATVPWAGI
jgi:hypothetical protein